MFRQWERAEGETKMDDHHYNHVKLTPGPTVKVRYKRAGKLPPRAIPYNQQGREHINTHLYTHMSRAELREAAQERARYYSQPPSPDLAGTWALLRGAWEWAAGRSR